MSPAWMKMSPGGMWVVGSSLWVSEMLTSWIVDDGNIGRLEGDMFRLRRKIL